MQNKKKKKHNVRCGLGALGLSTSLEQSDQAVEQLGAELGEIRVVVHGGAVVDQRLDAASLTASIGSCGTNTRAGIDAGLGTAAD
jgi:hypothetical protein